LLVRLRPEHLHAGVLQYDRIVGEHLHVDRRGRAVGRVEEPVVGEVAVAAGVEVAGVGAVEQGGLREVVGLERGRVGRRRARVAGPGASLRGVAPLCTPVPVEAAASSTVDAATLAQLQAVVQAANTAQAQAFAGGDPGPMRATATDSYYQQMVEINRRMQQSGVAAIQLLKLDWGDASVDGAGAQIETTETWRTTFA